MLALCGAALVLPQRPAMRAPRARPMLAAAPTEGAAAPELLTEDGGVTKRPVWPAPPGGQAEPDYGALVRIHYTCAFENGTVFDEKYREKPFEFQLNTGGSVDGVEEGVCSMRVGERAIITCAPEWAFGSAGIGDIVPPDTVVVYDIELLGWSDGPPVESEDLDLRAYRYSHPAVFALPLPSSTYREGNVLTSPVLALQ